MCMSSPSIPKAPDPIPMVTPTDPGIAEAVDRERRRRIMASGLKSTMLTGGSGLAGPAPGAAKTALGA